MLRRFTFNITTLLLTCGLLSCDFRNPDEGYDSDWEPDHSATHEDGDAQHPTDENETPNATGSLPKETDAAPYRRPNDIVADTATMQATAGEWSEMNESLKTSYNVYREDGKIAMIVEKTDASTRSYYYNDGFFFYFNESADDGSWKLTVEFDEYGDVRGSRKQVNGERTRIDGDRLSEIVEHAVELRLASEEIAE